jgi:threonine aldolase
MDRNALSMRPPKVIDLRSDALCAPTAEMWEAMRRAEVGWALYGEDRNVRELEELGASILGKEAALLVSTCSMANVLGLMTLAPPGTRLVAGRTMHVATTEALSISHPLGLMLDLVDDSSGVLIPEAVRDAITGLHRESQPRVSVVCLENSHNNAGGVAVSPAQTDAVADVAHRLGATIHLDGARLFNVAVALSVTPLKLAEAADTVAISLTKGLGAPWGALLCGSRAVIQDARINARRIGAASVHKAGIFAAAGIVALTVMPGRLGGDHHWAGELARELCSLPGLHVPEPRTNLVLADTSSTGLTAMEIVTRLGQQHILVLARSRTSIRFATYRQIGGPEIKMAIEALKTTLQPANALRPVGSEGREA